MLRQARLVETRRDGTYVYYRLADDDVFRLLRTLETLGHSRLADVQQVVQSYLDGHDELEPVTFKELRRLMREDDVTVVDVRPAEEYEAGHIPGALSVPVPDLKTAPARAAEGPRGDRVLPRAVLRVFARRGDAAPQARVSRPARARGVARLESGGTARGDRRMILRQFLHTEPVVAAPISSAAAARVLASSLIRSTRLSTTCGRRPISG